MAEQRPHRIAGASADERLRNAKRITLTALALALLAINQVTTQHAARASHFASWLGRPLMQWNTVSVRPAWAWITWFIKWQWTPQLQPLRKACFRATLYPLGIIGAIAGDVLAHIRLSRFANRSDLHGSAHWATTRDPRAALWLDTGPVLTVPGGVPLGRWQRTHLRDWSPAQVPDFASARSGKGVCVVLSTLLTWSHAVLENRALTAGVREGRGQSACALPPPQRTAAMPVTTRWPKLACVPRTKSVTCGTSYRSLTESDSPITGRARARPSLPGRAVVSANHTQVERTKSPLPTNNRRRDSYETPTHSLSE